jgi:hypothetical protein
MVLSGFHIL